MYGFSIFSHGSCRRSLLSASRSRENFFSFASSFLRSLNHRSCETTEYPAVPPLIAILILPFDFAINLLHLFDAAASCSTDEFTLTRTIRVKAPAPSGQPQ